MNEGSPPKRVGLSALLEGIEFPVKDPVPQKVVSEPAQADVTDNRPDLPAHNETTGSAIPVITPQLEVLKRKDEEIMAANNDDVKSEKETRTLSPQTDVHGTENGIEIHNEMKKGFDPSSLRLSQDYAALVEVKKTITQVPIRQPDKQWFVRVNPDPAWRFEVAILDFRGDRTESYVVVPELYPSLSLEVVPKVLFAAVNRQNLPFLWPTKLPSEDGRLDSWNQSRLEAVERAKKNWIKVVPNMLLQAYDLYEAQGDLPEPEWPNLTFDEILNIAFKGRVIDNLDHPVLKRLRGEV
jgi:hypothetical protein